MSFPGYVLKFGGTSVGSPEAVRKILSILNRYTSEGKQLAVVVSAFAGITDRLLRLVTQAEHGAQNLDTLLEQVGHKHHEMITTLLPESAGQQVQAEIQPLLQELADILHGIRLTREATPRSRDLVMSFGERLSATILSGFFRENGLPAQFVDTRALIITDDRHGSARVLLDESYEKIRAFFRSSGPLPVLTGFIAATQEGITTTLGRGGSDYTASLIAAALGAEELQIWTDVSGVMTANPSVVEQAFSLPSLAYEEALELSHFGAKVLHPPTLHPVLSRNIPVRILNTFEPDFAGTVISAQASRSEHPVTGLSSIDDVALLRIQGSGMVGVTGISARLFQALAQQDINVILITQASSEHTICVAVTPEAVTPARQAIEAEFQLELQLGLMDPVVIEKECAVVAAVGMQMRRTPGISGKLFQALGQHNINVMAIAQGSSELNISIVIAQQDAPKALNVLHRAFFSPKGGPVALFLAGAGQVGTTLLRLLQEHEERQGTEEDMPLRLTGLANSRKILFDPNGIDPEQALERLDAEGSPASLQEIIARVRENPPGRSVFVDCTASQFVADLYPDIIRAGSAIVTANKLANTAGHDFYLSLRQLAAEQGLPFRYGTNVGAGLPVLRTLRMLLDSGDRITKIEGVLSGTLSYLFNTYMAGGRPFSEIVRTAREQGYTEPDPRIDLSGTDMARKLLILIRETGVAMEMEEIDLQTFLPASCFAAGSIDDFFLALEKQDADLAVLRKKAAAELQKLCYIAVYEHEENQARLSLQRIGPEHPFFNLKDSENIVAFTTEFYHETPLVIRGPGAGLEVTAAGVLADIIETVRILKR